MAIDLDKLPGSDSPDGVRRTTNYFAFVCGAIAVITFQTLILTTKSKTRLAELAGTNRVWWELVGGALLVWLLFDVARVHVSVYDRLFVKWVKRHKAEFLLPKMIGPFSNRLDMRKVDDAVRGDPERFLDRLFRPFVSGSPALVGNHYVTRFYEALSMYWISQVFEFFAVLWLVGLYFYATIGQLTGHVTVSDFRPLFFGAGVCSFILAANQLFWVRPARKRVRDRAAQEIDAILGSAELREILQTETYRLATERELFLSGAASLFRTDSPAHGSPIASANVRRVFLGSPMSSLTEDEYRTDRALCLRVAEALKTTLQVDVFYAGRDIESSANFDDVALALRMDIREVVECDVYVLHLPKNVPTSALFEFGFAMALGKKGVIVAKQGTVLPFLLRAITQVLNATTTSCQYRTVDDLVPMLSDLRNGPLARFFGDQH